MDQFMVESAKSGETIKIRDTEETARRKAKSFAAVEDDIVTLYRLQPVEFYRPDGRSRRRMKQLQPIQTPQENLPL